MSKNALALVDCNNRDVLFQYLLETFDRKASRNEMVSPYDDQLIGKMNFRYNNAEHAMFFTYARASEYPGLRFRNRKIIYLSLGVNDTSSDIFQQICTCFGGFINYNDDLDDGWQKIERAAMEYDPWQAAMDAANAAEPKLLDVRWEMRQMLGMESGEDGAEEPEYREVSRKEPNKQERRRSNSHRGSNIDGEKRDFEKKDLEKKESEKKEQEKREYEKKDSVEKHEPKGEAKGEQHGGGKGERSETRPRRPRNHYRGHGKPRNNKSGQKKPDGKEQKPAQKPAEKKQKTRQEKPTGSASQA